MKQIKDNYT